jgi:TolB-like protein
LLYLFEDYALDTSRRELRRGAALVSLEPQVFDFLEYLVRNRERVVSKDDLIASIWDGRIVSESALSNRINAARSAVGDNGEDQRLIRTVTRKGVRFVGNVDERQESTSVAARQPRQYLALPDKPSIAVVPFQSMSSDPDQEYFADGTVEEIITALSRFSNLFVIARNSTFVYKGRAVDVRQAARELGVRYVLEGSVRKAADQVRITGQLIDASSGVHLWADRFEGSLENIFDLQDQLTSSVVGAIALKVEQAEIKRAKRKPTESLDAYECFLRGMASYYKQTREAIDESLRMFYMAIELDPDYASAYGMAAWCYGWRKINGWITDPAKSIAEAGRLARRAAELGPDDAVALSRGGHALGYVVGDLDAAATFIERALVLNPNLAGAWYAAAGVELIAVSRRGRSSILRVPCASVHSIDRSSRCRVEPHSLISWPVAMTRRCPGRRKQCGRKRITRLHYSLLRQAAHLPDELWKQERPWFAYLSSIPRCASPMSRIGSRSAATKTSKDLRTAYEKPACRRHSSFGCQNPR